MVGRHLPPRTGSGAAPEMYYLLDVLMEVTPLGAEPEFRSVPVALSALAALSAVRLNLPKVPPPLPTVLTAPTVPTGRCFPRLFLTPLLLPPSVGHCRSGRD